MKFVFRASSTSADQEPLKSLLDQANIPCLIRNENLSVVLGAECSPEIWIQNDEDYLKAKAIVDAWRNAEIETQDPWVCRCGETIEGQFSSCWKCGKER